MFWTQWLALTAAAFALTMTWLLRPDERTYVTTALSFAAWSAAALTATGLEIVDNGATVAAGSPVLALVATAFAALSVLALLGYRTGHYPPEETQTDDPFVTTDD